MPEEVDLRGLCVELLQSASSDVREAVERCDVFRQKGALSLLSLRQQRKVSSSGQCVLQASTGTAMHCIPEVENDMAGRTCRLCCKSLHDCRLS